MLTQGIGLRLSLLDSKQSTGCPRLRMALKIIKVQWQLVVSQPGWPLPTFVIYSHWHPAPRPAHGAVWFHSLLWRQKQLEMPLMLGCMSEVSAYLCRQLVSQPISTYQIQEPPSSISRYFSQHLRPRNQHNTCGTTSNHHKLARLKSGWNNRNGLVSTWTPLVARGCPLPPWHL